MTSLQGYVKASYDEIIEVFGEPSFQCSWDLQVGDGKVETEWELTVDDTNVTIYDWKEYDNGSRSRSGTSYRWHIGGTSREAVTIVSNRLNKDATYAGGV